MIKPLNCNKEVVKLILDDTFVKCDHANEFNANNKDNEYLMFTINDCNNFYFYKVTSSLR